MNEPRNEQETHELLPNCKDILSQMGPLDTLLGSVVSYSDTDSIEGKIQQIRTSARVFKKMKFDLTNNAATEKKVEVKKEEVKPEDIKHEIKKNVSPLWTSEEKNLFFEALNEFGKDFESIHLFISTRLKKRGIPEDAIKTKYQIRNFYYRTFHMCGDLKFNESIPKNVQELYALINYGEVRKKVGALSKKGGHKLRELVHNGHTSIKYKGKAVKIKTPMCRALRRLNQLDEKYDDLKLPTRVLVELKPKDMVSFVRVQSMAQNPRIRMALSLQKRLSSLITCINTRWKSTEAIIYDNALIATNPTTKECVPDKKTIDENVKLLTPSVRLSPPHNAHVELPSIDISEYFTGQSICLTAFQNRKLVRAQKVEVKNETESNSTKTEKNLTGKIFEENTPPIVSTISVHTVVDDAVNTILTLQTDLPKVCDKISEIKVENNNIKTKNSNVDNKNEVIEQIKQGWTIENCGGLTIGELYLMFGSDSKLMLEYDWDSQEKQENTEFELKAENFISNSLKSLLSLAKLQTHKTESKCTCGHICGRNTTQFKRPISTKLLKKNQANQENAIEENELSNSAVLIQSKIHKISNKSFHYSNSQMLHLRTKLDIERLNSKCRNKGKPRCKQLVVERKLIPNKLDPKHQIVSMNIIAQENRPVKNPTNNVPQQSASSTMKIKEEIKIVEEEESFTGKDFSGILSDNPSNSSMSTGISKILKENENQWINNTDVSDYSLSSLLGHLDGATKTNQSTVNISHDDSQLSHDVDAQLRTLLTEASVDYTAKFADLAAQVVDRK